MLVAKLQRQNWLPTKNEMVLLLKETGFTLVGTVCDQGSTNQGAVHALVKETDAIRHTMDCQKR